MGSSIVDGLGCDQNSDDFELVPDGTRLTADFSSIKYQFISCFASTPFCPKLHLKKLLDDPSVEQSGLQIGIEFEFYILPIGSTISNSMEPGMHAYQLSSFIAYQDVHAAIYRLLESLEIEHFCLHPEGSEGQFEISFGKSQPYEIATKYALLRSLLPGVAANLGYQVLFTPRPFKGQFINALHINFSWKNYTRDQQFERAKKIARSSPYYQIVYNPTEESYFALTDTDILKNRPNIENWIACEARNSIIRYVERDGRFEFRLPDPSANIYSTISAMILSYLAPVELPYTTCERFCSSLMNSNLAESRNSFDELVLAAPKDRKSDFFGLGGLFREKEVLKGIE